MDRLGGYFGTHEADDHLDYELDDDDSILDSPPSPVGQDERRMQVRAYNHWASLLGDRAFPAIEDLEPELLDDFGPYSVLLDLTVGLEDAEIRFLGEELAQEANHGGLTRLADVPSRSVLSRITDHYMQILANQAPIGFEAEFVTDRGSSVLYRGILLPYSSDSQTIDFIYGVINWKEMADQATADELLLEIDQALAGDVALEEAMEEAEVAPAMDLVAADPVPLPTLELELAAAHALADEDDDDSIYDLEPAAMIEPARHELPRPEFGADPVEDAGQPAPRASRAVDALGNPLGVPVSDEDGWQADDFGDDDIDRSIKTAADYGLPDWDDEEEDEDVEGLVDPLAGEDEDDGSGSLVSLVSRGMRNKKSVDLSSLDLPAPVPQAYEAEDTGLHPFETEVYDLGPDAGEVEEFVADEAFAADFAADTDAADTWAEESPADADARTEDMPLPLQTQAVDEVAYAETGNTGAPEGLYDALASARELAQAALTTEDRSRKTLYAAVSQAYDFSLEAVDDPDGYQEIIADNGLTMQDRAPMTPIVKLVFGAEYDKTRLTEYAAVLTHAHRVGVERGSLASWLREADGGLKGVVQAERRARREEQGKPVEEVRGVRAALAKKLRALDPVDLAAVADGESEFALVMVRRLSDGSLAILGEVPEDIALIEKAARKLLG